MNEFLCGCCWGPQTPPHPRGRGWGWWAILAPWYGLRYSSFIFSSRKFVVCIVFLSYYITEHMLWFSWLKFRSYEYYNTQIWNALVSLSFLETCILFYLKCILFSLFSQSQNCFTFTCTFMQHINMETFLWTTQKPRHLKKYQVKGL